MEAATKTLLSKVLAHQLEGIMLHYDLMAMYKILGMDRMSCIHYRQLKDETIAHAKSALNIIDKEGEVVVPAARNRITIKQVTSEPKDVIDKLTYHAEYLAAWRAWEETTVTFYDDVISAMPNCNFWQTLKQKAEHEIHCVNRIISDLA